MIIAYIGGVKERVKRFVYKRERTICVCKKGEKYKKKIFSKDIRDESSIHDI